MVHPIIYTKKDINDFEFKMEEIKDTVAWEIFHFNYVIN